MRAIKALVTAFVVIAVTTGVAVAGGAGAQKADLLGPNGNAWCDGSGVITGVAGDYGFAVVNAPENGTVKATVSLKKQAPDTNYPVRLVQGGADCFTVDFTITTNGQGNGTGSWSEPSVTTHAFVAVDTGALFGVPAFVTETYNH